MTQWRTVPPVEARALLPAALLAAADHDLRGALAKIQTGADTLAMHTASPALRSVADMVSATSSDVARQLVELLDAAGAIVRGEAAEELVDLPDLVDGILGTRGVGRCTSTGGQVAVRVVGRPVLLRHLIDNLVANAVTASGAAAVEVLVEASGVDRVLLEIVNDLHGQSSTPRAISPDVLHTGPGRGLGIATILAAAGDITLDTREHDGRHVTRLDLPGVWHPSAGSPPGQDRTRWAGGRDRIGSPDAVVGETER